MSEKLFEFQLQYKYKNAYWYHYGEPVRASTLEAALFLLPKKDSDTPNAKCEWRVQWNIPLAEYVAPTLGGWKLA